VKQKDKHALLKTLVKTFWPHIIRMIAFEVFMGFKGLI